MCVAQDIGALQRPGGFTKIPTNKCFSKPREALQSPICTGASQRSTYTSTNVQGLHEAPSVKGLPKAPYIQVLSEAPNIQGFYDSPLCTGALRCPPYTSASCSHNGLCEALYTQVLHDSPK